MKIENQRKRQQQKGPKLLQAKPKPLASKPDELSEEQRFQKAQEEQQEEWSWSQPEEQLLAEKEAQDEQQEEWSWWQEQKAEPEEQLLEKEALDAKVEEWSWWQQQKAQPEELEQEAQDEKMEEWSCWQQQKAQPEEQLLEQEAQEERQEEWWWQQQQRSFAEAVAPVPECDGPVAMSADFAEDQTEEPMETVETVAEETATESMEEPDVETEMSETLLDALEAQISAEAERVQELERQLRADSVGPVGSDTETETEEEAETRPAKVPKLHEDAKHLIHRYGASHSLLLTSPSTPPLEQELPTPTGPTGPAGFSDADADLAAPRTPPLWESPEAVQGVAPLLANLLSGDSGGFPATAGSAGVTHAQCSPKSPPTAPTPMAKPELPEVDAPPDPEEPPQTARGSLAPEPQVVPLLLQSQPPQPASAFIPQEWTAAANSSRRASTLEELVGTPYCKNQASCGFWAFCFIMLHGFGHGRL